MTTAREAIARALDDPQIKALGSDDRFKREQQAIAIIYYLWEAGLRIVPAEATEAMLRAGQRAWLADPQRKSSTLYRAMISAYEDGK